MSGREPVAAFFPSIDRNLIAELDRHLRAPAAAEPASSAPTGRPDIEGVVEAVEHAASSIVAMTARIHELEGHVTSLDAANAQLDAANKDLDAKLAHMAQRHAAAETQAQAHHARAEETARIAQHHATRANSLEQELATALADLNRVTDAIASALGLPTEP